MVLSEATKWYVLPERVCTRPVIGTHVCRGWAWLYSVRRDLARCQVDREATNEARNRGFSHRVNGGAGKEGSRRQGTTDGDNSASLGHEREDGLNGGEQRRDVGPNHAVEILGREVSDSPCQ